MTYVLGWPPSPRFLFTCPLSYYFIYPWSLWDLSLDHRNFIILEQKERNYQLQMFPLDPTHSNINYNRTPFLDRLWKLSVSLNFMSILWNKKKSWMQIAKTYPFCWRNTYFSIQTELSPKFFYLPKMMLILKLKKKKL